MKKSYILIFLILLLVITISGCSSLFGPSLDGDTHIEKAVDGATRIEKSESVDEKLIQLFNVEYIKAYEDSKILIEEAKNDVSKYLDLPYDDFNKLAISYNNIKNKYSSLINSEVDFPYLVKDINMIASKKLFDTALTLDKNTDDTNIIDKYVTYIRKAYELDKSLKEKGIKIINEYYIIAGDIKVKSTKTNDLIYAISYYKKVLNTDENNVIAKEKMEKAKEKQIELKISSINDLLKCGNSYKDYYEANKIFDSLDEKTRSKYSDLEKEIEQKRSAIVLFCVNTKDNIDLPQTKEFEPNYPMNKVDTSPEKIIVDFININSQNFDIPSKYNYVFIPDSNFGDIEYDYDTVVSDNISVDFTKDRAEQVLYETALKQNPNDEDAKKALESGTYKETITTVQRSVNDIYHIYKVNNGKKEKIKSTELSIDKVELKEIQYISGSKEAIKNKTRATFDTSNYWGERFNYSSIKEYFNPISVSQLYNSYFRSIKSYFSLFE